MDETRSGGTWQGGWASDVLAFWFDALEPEQWFESTPELDATIRSRFLPLYERLAGDLPSEVWRDPQAALAAVLVLDQFPRNMFRGTGRAFATDTQARAVVRSALDRGLDGGLSPEQKRFLYMPLMHSEALDDHERCIELLQPLGNAEALRYAEEHRDIIARFGRFPHRNKALGRASTSEEAVFLRQHAGYGQ